MASRLAQYPEIKAILDRLRGGKGSELIILFVPSHDKNEKPVSDQDQWAHKALKLFGKLYDGATAFQNLNGVYHSKDMKRKGLRPSFDNPIMIQSLADASDVEKEENLLELAGFCREMGQKMNQWSVGIVVNNKYIDIVINHV
jgi:hypothetical protein